MSPEGPRIRPPRRRAPRTRPRGRRSGSPGPSRSGAPNAPHGAASATAPSVAPRAASCGRSPGAAPGPPSPLLGAVHAVGRGGPRGGLFFPVLERVQGGLPSEPGAGREHELRPHPGVLDGEALQHPRKTTYQAISGALVELPRAGKRTRHRPWEGPGWCPARVACPRPAWRCRQVSPPPRRSHEPPPVSSIALFLRIPCSLARAMGDSRASSSTRSSIRGSTASYPSDAVSASITCSRSTSAILLANQPRARAASTPWSSSSPAARRKSAAASTASGLAPSAACLRPSRFFVVIPRQLSHWVGFV